MYQFFRAGDEELAIDIVANNVIFQNLKNCGSVATASSIETPTEGKNTQILQRKIILACHRNCKLSITYLPHHIHSTLDAMGGKGYSVAFEPLEGSSVIDTNFAVGTIWGVWPGDSLTGVKGRQMKAAGVAVYGPRTTITLAIDNMDYSHEFVLVEDMSAMQGQWLKSNEYTTISEGKLISPGNLRATQDNKGYADLFNYWMQNTYQLRYTGGLVADVNQLMVKGKGVFAHVQSENTVSELQLLYEVAPLAYLIEKAGGKSTNGEKSILDVPITSTEQTSQVAFGSKNEVKRFDEFVGTKFL